MNTVYLGLGTNLKNRESFLEKARNLIYRRVGTIEATSSVYETEPWGYSDQPPFLNQVILIRTNRSAEEILDLTKSIEIELGKNTPFTNGPRTIDIDILFVNDFIIRDVNLSVPHPKIEERNFVLIPLLEIAADHTHPVHGKSISQLHHECIDTSEVKILTADNLGTTL